MIYLAAFIAILPAHLSGQLKSLIITNLQMTDGPMFMAYIVACLTGAEYCTKIEDMRGPYKTEQSCEARTVEMRDYLADVLGSEYFFKYKCELVSPIRGDNKELDLQKDGLLRGC